MSSAWTYLGEPISEPIEGAVGFLYVITNIKSNRRYVGQKLFYSKVTKAPLKGKTNKRRSVKTSDWINYWGSSDSLKLDILKLGEESFTREIVLACESKAQMNYYELKMQMDADVLLHQDKFYNGIVNARVNWKQLAGTGGSAVLKKVARQKVLTSSTNL